MPNIKDILDWLIAWWTEFRNQTTPPPEKEKEETKTETMANFDIAYSIVKEWEGGYTERLADRGNWICPRTGGWVDRPYPYTCSDGSAPLLIGTNFGVAAPNLKQILGYIPTSKSDSKNLTRQQAANWFYTDVWLKSKLDLIVDQSVANILFDGIVNHGRYWGTVLMQREVGVNADGLIGPVTLNAINTYNSQAGLFLNYQDARWRFYQQLIANNPEQQENEDGWRNRLNDYRYTPTNTGGGNPPTPGGNTNNPLLPLAVIATLFFIFRN